MKISDNPDDSAEEIHEHAQLLDNQRTNNIARNSSYLPLKMKLGGGESDLHAMLQRKRCHENRAEEQQL